MNFKIVYGLAIGLYEMGLWLGAAFSSKVRRMLIGRSISISKVKKFRTEQPDADVFWFHAASVGEFEQALPIIRLLKDQNPDIEVAVSFYSPSGFEMRSKHPLVDVSFYLLADRSWNAAKIIKILKPKALILVKYEFWYQIIATCHRFQVPVLSVCCILKPNSLRSWPYSVLLKRCFPLIRHFFVQNSETSQILREAGIQNITINGDTRVDRVLEVQEIQSEIQWLEEWKGDHKLLIIGSAWTEDLIYLREFIRHAVVEAHGLWRVLVVPHEINENHLKHLISALQLPYEFYTNWKDSRQETDILVLNTLGLLSKTYRYADAAWIGGAFKTGLHNTLEAAVYGIPVGFGPKYEKFQEAKDLLRIGVACSFPGKTTVWEFFQNSTELEEEKQRIDETAGLYFDSQKGASDVILRFITQENYKGTSSD